MSSPNRSVESEARAEAGSRPDGASRPGATRLLGHGDLTLAEVLEIARGEQRAEVDGAADHRAKLERSRAVIEAQQRSGEPVYGVTTGVGASASNEIPEDLRDEMALNLLRFHGCGTGRTLDETEAASVLVIRLATLARGHSGVRIELLERLAAMLDARLLPRIPEEGSVGASGDLTPLSYLAAAVVGEREVTLGGNPMGAAEALAEIGLEPLRLLPKESLALMNGTSVMTAIACVCVERAEALARLACAVSAMIVDATHGNRAHYDDRISQLKPHPGQRLAADWIRADLRSDFPERPAARLQDRYSLRCAPHVIGVLLDTLATARATLEIEINGVDDNPLVDPDGDAVLHGGNFYGGHVAFAMDSVKVAVANVADLLDRQLALLCDPQMSDGLPANLVASGSFAHHGFKAMQISASALAAEALKLTMPASVFSRSTESHNQDKVSMGTIAARDCRRILELSETVASITLLASCQAFDLRGEEQGSRRGRSLRDAIRKEVPFLKEDRRQDIDIARVHSLFREGALPLAVEDAPGRPLEDRD